MKVENKRHILYYWVASNLPRSFEELTIEDVTDKQIELAKQENGPSIYYYNHMLAIRGTMAEQQELCKWAFEKFEFGGFEQMFSSEIRSALEPSKRDSSTYAILAMFVLLSCIFVLILFKMPLAYAMLLLFELALAGALAYFYFVRKWLYDSRYEYDIGVMQMFAYGEDKK